MLAHAHEHTLCTGQRLSYEFLVVHDELDRDVVEPVDHGPNPVVDVGILSDFERKTNRIYVCSRARSLPSLDPRPLTTSTSPIAHSLSRAQGSTACTRPSNRRGGGGSGSRP